LHDLCPLDNRVPGLKVATLTDGQYVIEARNEKIGELDFLYVF
jgi:hypothetical protein